MPFFVFAKGVPTIVMDYDSGRILYENDIHEKALIASITKIMTCIIVLENAELDDQIEVGEEVLEMYGTNIYVEIGECLTIRDLLYGLMLRSGNDAAVVLSHHIFESEEIFITKMNEKAKEIGMNDTIFLNSHGLDEETENYSTVYDMALLARYAFQNKEYQKIISTKKYQTKSNFKSYVWYNRMSLLNEYSYCIGGKNGYTPRAGKTLVSYARKDNKTFLIVSFNDSNLYQHHISLYEKYFDLYDNYLIIDSKNISFPSSFFDEDAYIKDSFSYLLGDDEIDNVSTLLEVHPLKNNILGKIIIQLNQEKIGEVTIYSHPKKKKDSFNIFQKIQSIFR